MKTLELHYTGNDPIVSKCTIHIDLVTSQHKNNESLNKVIHSLLSPGQMTEILLLTGKTGFAMN